MKIKAWSVTTDDADAGVLVWAATRGRAKHIALTSLWLECCDFTDLRATREPKADGLRDHPCAMDEEPTYEDYKLMHSLGWREIDGRQEPCTKCEMYEWRELVQSHIDDTGVCAGCRHKETPS